MNKKVSLGYLFFILPLLFFLFINFSRETDIWFILAHGKYIFSNGFPHIEFLTIHEGLHFVMQQWGFSLITYILYHYIGSVGVITFVGIINILIIIFLYKLCLLISNNRYFSCLVASLIDLLLELNFIIPRPQIFSLLIILITIYILERKDKSIYFLPLLSFLLINFHASMWLMIFIICIPFLCEYIIKKDKYIIKLLSIMIISFIIGFINPYGIEAMSYVFTSYGVDIIKKLIREMYSFSFTGEDFVVYNSIMFLIEFIVLIICIIKNIKKYSIHSILLILGLSLMAFINLRNISLFLVGAFPYVVFLFNKNIYNEINIKYFVMIVIFILCLFVYKTCNNEFKLNNEMDDVVSFLDEKYNKKDIILYNEFGDGPYLEYYGYKVYIDTRAEIFIKKINRKEDILKEYYKVISGKINYSNFFNKYMFTHLVVHNKSNIYEFLKLDSNYKIIYNKNKDIYVFERVNLISN